MKTMGKIVVSLVSALIIVCVASCGGGGGGKVIGEIDKGEVVYLHVLSDDTPVAVILEEKPGTISTIKEYYLMYGKEKMGPYDSINYSSYDGIQYSANNTSFVYKATVDGQDMCFFVNKEIKELPLLSDYYGVILSPDGKTYAYYTKTNYKYWVIEGDKKNGPYDAIANTHRMQTFKYLADSRLCYAAKINRESYIFIGNKKMGPFNYVNEWYEELMGDGPVLPPQIPFPCFFSDNNEEVAFSVGKRDKAYLLYKNKEFGPFDGVGYVRFQNEGQNISFIGRIGKQKYICVDDNRYGPFDSIVDFIFSPDNKKYACMSFLKGSYDFYLHIGDEKIGPLSYSSQDPIVDSPYFLDNISVNDWVTFLPDGSDYLYKTCYGDETTLHFGKETLGPFPKIGNVVFSNNKKDFAFVVYEDYFYKEGYIVQGQKKVGPYDNIEHLYFLSDGKTLVYTAKIDDKYYVFCGDKKTCPFDYQPSLSLTLDGKAVKYSAELGEEKYVYLGDKKIATFNENGGESISIDYILDDASCFSYSEDYNNVEKVYINGSSYIGRIQDNKIVFCDGKKIMLKNF